MTSEQILKILDDNKKRLMSNWEWCYQEWKKDPTQANKERFLHHHNKSAGLWEALDMIYGQQELEARKNLGENI